MGQIEGEEPKGRTNKKSPLQSESPASHLGKSVRFARFQNPSIVHYTAKTVV